MNFAIGSNFFPSGDDHEYGYSSDEFGLRTLGNFYAPYLEHEIERLFMTEVAFLFYFKDIK